MTDTNDRLCGRVDGSTTCAAECWRARALHDEPCRPIPKRGMRWAGGVLAATMVAGTLLLLPTAADAGTARRDGVSRCRMAGHCPKPKPKPTAVPTSQPTPVAPGCVEYGPACVIDLTTTWPTPGPVVETAVFPCPMTIPTDETTEPAEPCVEVTVVTTYAAQP